MSQRQYPNYSPASARKPVLIGGCLQVDLKQGDRLRQMGTAPGIEGR
jgi:hypothetical protein